LPKDDRKYKDLESFPFKNRDLVQQQELCGKDEKESLTLLMNFLKDNVDNRGELAKLWEATIGKNSGRRTKAELCEELGLVIMYIRDKIAIKGEA